MLREFLHSSIDSFKSFDDFHFCLLNVHSSVQIFVYLLRGWRVTRRLYSWRPFWLRRHFVCFEVENSRFSFVWENCLPCLFEIFERFWLLILIELSLFFMNCVQIFSKRTDNLDMVIDIIFGAVDHSSYFRKIVFTSSVHLLHLLKISKHSLHSSFLLKGNLDLFFHILFFSDVASSKKSSPVTGCMHFLCEKYKSFPFLTFFIFSWFFSFHMVRNRIN